MEGRFKIIIIEWEDSRRPNPSWQWIEDFAPQEVCICKTIGYLIKSTNKALYVAQSITDDNQMAGVITIPWKSVIRKAIISDIEQYQKKDACPIKTETINFINSVSLLETGEHGRFDLTPLKINGKLLCAEWKLINNKIKVVLEYIPQSDSYESVG
jgi:hypothetical protein